MAGGSVEEKEMTINNCCFLCKSETSKEGYRYQHISKTTGKPVDTYLCKECYEALKSNQEKLLL
jgi:uncharacterized protein YlaI